MMAPMTKAVISGADTATMRTFRRTEASMSPGV
jgi:hypothetical protein